MNQSQLETAIHRVTNDKSLDLPRKAYIIQNIMTTRYIVAQQKRMKISHAEPSPADDVSSDGSHFSILEHRPSSLGLPPHSRNLRPEELEAIRSYHPSSLGSDVKVLGCKHYQRKCQLIAPCCGKAFTCRLCHDEAIASHRIDRFKVSEVLCMMCGARGPAAKSCCVCKADFSAYYCDICHLFDDNPSHSTYHCPFW